MSVAPAHMHMQVNLLSDVYKAAQQGQKINYDLTDSNRIHNLQFYTTVKICQLQNYTQGKSQSFTQIQLVQKN